MRIFANIFLFVVLIAFLSSCSKEENGIETGDTTSTVLFSGNFISGAHTTTGKVLIAKTTDNKYVLKLENYKTDTGPDLHIYLSPDKTAKSFVEIKAAPSNGTYSIPLDSTVDFNKNKFVLIWCKSFSVLFGSAELK